MILAVYYIVSVMKSQANSTIKQMCYDQGSMSERRPPQEIADIIEAVSNKDPDISLLDATTSILAAGYLFIGTAQSEPIHYPTSGQRYLDRHLDHEVYVEEPEQPILQATWSGKLAIMGAVFGDINKPGQRKAMGAPLTAEPHIYGWYGLHYKEVQARLGLADNDPGYHEDAIGIQADLELLHAVQKLHDNLTGSIDILRMDESFYLVGDKPEAEENRTRTRPGIVISRHAHASVATLPVFGSDLWQTNIVPTTEPGY